MKGEGERKEKKRERKYDVVPTAETDQALLGPRTTFLKTVTNVEGRANPLSHSPPPLPTVLPHPSTHQSLNSCWSQSFTISRARVAKPTIPAYSPSSNSIPDHFLPEFWFPWQRRIPNAPRYSFMRAVMEEQEAQMRSAPVMADGWKWRTREEMGRLGQAFSSVFVHM